MEKIKYAIFDMDGTLTDTMHIWDTGAGAFLMMRGIVPHDFETFRKRGYVAGINYMIEEYNLPLTYDEVMAELIKILEYYYNNVATAKPGVKDFLQKMQDNGVKMCIASATNRYLVEACLRRNGILDYFSKIYSTHEDSKPKTDPEVFYMASDFMNAEGDVWVFEDALYAIKTAKKAGFRVLAVEDYSAGEDRDEIKALADYYITDYNEIYNIFDLH